MNDKIVFKNLTDELGGYNKDTEFADKFFDDDPEQVQQEKITDDVTKQEQEVKKEDEQPKVKQKTIDDLREELFNDNPDKETEEVFKDDETQDEIKVNKPKEEKEKEITDEEIDYIYTLEVLKEKGLVDYELQEGEELTNDVAEELIEENLNKKVEERVGELFNELPDIVKQINKYVLDGGDLNKFFGSIVKSNQVGLSNDMDLEEVSNQELVARTIMREEGFDNEYINSQIELLKESNNLKKYSQQKFKVWTAQNEAEQRELFEKQEAERQQTIRERNESKKQISSLMSDTSKLGLSLSMKDKKEMASYLFDEPIRLSSGGTLSRFYNDFFDVIKNPVTMVQIATLIRNKNTDGSLNFNPIAKTVETKVVTKVKNEITRNKMNSPRKSSESNGSDSTKSLADYL